MKLALIIAVWRRHDLERIVIDNFKDQAKSWGFEIIIAGSEGEVSRELANGCHYIEVENRPLSNKHNAMIQKAKELNVDGVVLMGSDDIVCEDYWKHIYSLSSTELDIVGLKDLYFYSTETKQLSYWYGYQNGKMLAGAGRFFSKSVLEKCEWKLWGDGLNRGLDTNCSNRLASLGIGQRFVSMEEINSFLVDVKHSISITNGAIIKNCSPSNFNIMAKKVAAKTVKAVENLEHKKVELKNTEMYDVESTGVYKHLGVKGTQHNVTGEMAGILINKGFATLV